MSLPVNGTRNDLHYGYCSNTLLIIITLKTVM